MRKVWLYLLIFSTVLFYFEDCSTAIAGRKKAASISERGASGFYLAVGEYFKVPQKEILGIKKRKVKDEEIPVVLFISMRAGVPSSSVVELRLGGMSWLEICRGFKLGADIFHVEVKGEVKGPPYGHAYGFYRNKPRNVWKRIALGDADIVNLVNLRFVSEHYGYPPGEVIKMRSAGKGFVAITAEVENSRKKGPSGPKAVDKKAGKRKNG
ncbi:MAG: hypothetical protein HY890_08520 [Deltaproteobacteria bacterium]|nr:hypothetical protein [Deltaproteobacteria bacterium]